MKFGKKKILILLSLFCVSIFFISIVSAKYMHQTENTGTITAKEFYFKSDILDGNTHTVTADTTGTASVKITLMNHEDELRYSETDISYEIKIKNDAGEDVTTKNSEGLTGTLEKGENHDAAITIQGLQAGRIYTITASTTGNSYSKTLTGTIVVNSPDKNIYASISDKGEYVEITVWTKEYTGEISLEYPAGLIPDNTDGLLLQARNASENSLATVTLNNWAANTSHVFRFFKSDITKNDYKVTTDTNAKKVTVSE